jgi:hypothetical protein
MAKDIKAKVVTKPTGKQGGTNAPAKVSKKASVKFTGPQSKAPKGAIPSKKMGGPAGKKC